MRHFMMDVWIWTEDKHSKPLKTIRFEQDHFPTEKECWHWFTKDEDVEIYMKSDIYVLNLITYTNIISKQVRGA